MDPQAQNPPALPPAIQAQRRKAKALGQRNKASAKARANKKAPLLEATREQLNELEERMVSGWTPTRACDHYSVLWNLPFLTVQRWVRQVEQKWLDDAKAQGQDARHEWVIQQMQWYIKYARELAETGNHELMKCVPNMMERLARATGTYQASEVKVQVSGGINVGEMTDDLVKARIMELLGKHGHLLPGDPGDGRKTRQPKSAGP